MRITSFALLLSLACASLAVAEDDETGFVKITDGTSMKGWKINESPDSWTMEKDAFVAKGPRSHLFYVGDEKPFVNFELKIDLMTRKGSNGGVYFHTKYQETGWPKYGYESQVNNTHGDWRKSGSLYGVDDVKEDKNPAQDDKWWTQHIIVKGRQIVIKIDGKTVVDYTEAEDKAAGTDFTRKLDKGTFALQAHDPNSVVYFKNIRVKRLE